MALARPAPQLDVTRLSGSLGAEIRGISLACDYSIPLPQGRPPNFSQVNF